MRSWSVFLVLVTLPVLAADFPVSTPIYGAGEGFQSQNAVATDGRLFYVVWIRTRFSTDEPGRLMLTRVRGDGELIDRVPIQLVGGPVGYSASIIFNGTDFVVLWTTREGLFAAKMNSAGSLREAVRIGEIAAPAVAWNGSHYLITWGVRPSHFFRITGVLLDAELRKVRDLPVFGNNNAYNPRVATDGEKFLISYSEQLPQGGTTHLAFVTAAGDFQPSHVLGGNGRGSSDVVFDGNAFAVSYADRESIRLTRVTAGGTLLSTTTIAELRAFADIPLTRTAADPGGYLVTWQTADWISAIPEIGPWTKLFAARVSGDGTLQGAPRDLSTAEYQNSVLSLVWNGRDYFGTWIQSFDLPPAPISVRGSLLTREGEVLQSRGVLKGIPISITANQQGEAKLVWTGSVFLATWPEYFWDWGETRLLAGRISPTGRLLDGPGVELARVGRSDPMTRYFWGARFDLAVDHDRALVTWTERDERSSRHMARLLSIAETIDPEPSFDALGFSSVSANHGLFLLKGQGAFVRITAEGTVLDPGGKPLPRSHQQIARERIVPHPNGFLVIVQQEPTQFCQDCVGTLAYVISSTGEVGPLIRLSFLFSVAAGRPDGSEFLLLFRRSKGAVFPPDSDVAGQFVRIQGTAAIPGSELAVTESARIEEPVSAAFDGSDYVVTWTEKVTWDYGPSLARAARVTTSGAVLPLKLDPVPQFAEVQARPGQPSVLTYTRWAADPPFFGSERAFIQFLDERRVSRRRATR